MLIYAEPPNEQKEDSATWSATPSAPCPRREKANVPPRPGSQSRDVFSSDTTVGLCGLSANDLGLVSVHEVVLSLSGHKCQTLAVLVLLIIWTQSKSDCRWRCSPTAPSRKALHSTGVVPSCTYSNV